MSNTFVNYLTNISDNLDTSLENINNENIKFKKFGDLVIFKYKNKYGSELERACRGLIIDIITGKIICSSNTGTIDLESFIKKVPLEECVIERNYEGTLINVYFYKNRWNISTKFCINSENSKFRSKKSFRQYFDDLFKVDYANLDKNFTYSFLLQIPTNRLVTKINKKNIYHLETQNNITGEKIDINIGVQKPEVLKLEEKNLLGIQSFRDINRELSNLDWGKRGFMLYSHDRKYRCSLINPNYNAIYELVKNQSNISFLILESLYFKNNLEKYIEYFPEYTITLDRVKQDFNNLITRLFNRYKEAYCYKNCEHADIEEKYKSILNKVHKLYKINHRNDLLFRIEKEHVKKIVLEQSCPYIFTILYKI
mgnify:CR=1 FL=1